MKTLKGRFIAVIIGVIALTSLLAWFLLGGMLKTRLYRQAEMELDSHAQVVAEMLSREGLTHLPGLLRNLESVLNGRITVVAMDGKVLFDNRATLSELDNHANRPEIMQARAEGKGNDIRYSRSLNANFMYSALVTRTPNGPSLVVRMSYPLTYIDETLNQFKQRLLLALAIAAAFSILLGLFVAQRLVHPILDLEKTANRVEKGETVIFPVSGTEEIRNLSFALKSMADRLQKSLREQEEAREDLNRMVQSLPVGVIVADEEGYVRFGNEWLRDLFRDTPEKIMGTPLQGALRVPEIAGITEKLAEEEKVSESFLVPGNRDRLLNVQAVRLRGGSLIVVTDLTERYQLEEARRAFIADASHEFQTPLTAIRAAAELLLGETTGEREDRNAEYLNRIIENQERLTTLVDDLLLLSRLESGIPEEEGEEVDLALLTASLIQDEKINPLAERIEWDVALTPSMVIEGRHGELTRALGNILDNAVKYTRQRFPETEGGRISVRLEAQGEEGILLVSDNGVGISPELREAIFERFQRGEPDRARSKFGKGGYGLGLAIARQIIEAHGGQVRVLDTDEGASFEIHLPL